MMDRRVFLRLMGGVAAAALIPSAALVPTALPPADFNFNTLTIVPDSTVSMLYYAHAEIVRCYGIPRHMLIALE